MPSPLKFLFCLVGMLLLFVTLPAVAQMEPKSTYPIAGSTVTDEIVEIRVEFKEPIDPTMSGLELRRGGTQIWVAGVGVGFCDANSCHLPLGQLEPDSYTVAYDVFTTEGNVIKQEFHFIVVASALKSK